MKWKGQKGLGQEAEEVMDPALVAARLTAREGRDSTQGKDALVNLWREVSKPRGGGAIKLQPDGCKLDCPGLFQQWLEQRGLQDVLSYTGEQQGWSVYSYDKTPVVKSQPWWEQAFHGSWWYSVWLILETGIFLESDDKGLGHDFWEPGVYCSPSLDTGLWYARPQNMFGDGVYHRIIFELRVDPERRKRNRARGGVQWVFPCAGVALHAVWIRSNAPPNKGEERVNSWDAELEALPPGSVAPPPVVNPRTGHWPHHVDPHRFILGDTSVPPWMMATDGKKSAGKDAVPAAAAAVLPAQAPGGLYGRWLKQAERGELHPSWTPGKSAAPASTAPLGSWDESDKSAGKAQGQAGWQGKSGGAWTDGSWKGHGKGNGTTKSEEAWLVPKKSAVLLTPAAKAQNHGSGGLLDDESLERLLMESVEQDGGVAVQAAQKLLVPRGKGTTSAGAYGKGAVGGGGKGTVADPYGKGAGKVGKVTPPTLIRPAAHAQLSAVIPPAGTVARASQKRPAGDGEGEWPPAKKWAGAKGGSCGSESGNNWWPSVVAKGAW
jgi:hypothetical protein